MPMKTREEQREYQRLWIALRREEWIRESGPCIDCGSEENLEVDHVDAKLKTLATSALWGMTRTNPKRIQELSKCVVRCNTCHKVKTKIHREHARGEAHPRSLTEDCQSGLLGRFAKSLA